MLLLALSKWLSLPLPDMSVDDERPDDGDDGYEGDRVLLQRDLSPQEAHVIAGMLNAHGIVADAGDIHFIQAYSLLAVAAGGACVRVPASRLEEAQALLAAYQRGDLDVDGPPSTDD